MNFVTSSPFLMITSSSFLIVKGGIIQDAEKDINVTWPRWKKQVIDKQIKTAKGAEGYIKKGQPIYLDNRCQKTISRNNA